MVDLHKGFDGAERLGPSDEEKRSSEEKKDFSKEEIPPAGERLSPGEGKKSGMPRDGV